MKELSAHVTVDPTIRVEQQQIKKKAYIGSMKLHKGQKCFELNLNTGVIVEADIISTVDIHCNIYRKLDIKEDCIYLTAINLFNAKRKFVLKLKKQMHG